MSQEEIYNIMAKKLSNELTEEGEKQFQQLIEGEPAKKKMFEMLKHSWEVQTNDKKKFVRKELYRKILQRIEEDEKQTKMVRFPFQKFMKYAAILLVGGVCYGLWGIFSPEEATSEIVYVEKTNPYGQRSSVSLPDGSSISLNAGSAVKYPKDFSNNRNIELKGEAFFEVARDPDHPFTVSTSHFTVQALGTSFNIKAFEKEAGAVTVATGVVRVKERIDSMDNATSVTGHTLVLGDRLVYDKENRIFNKSQVDLDKYLSWKEGRLVFDRVSFHEVAVSLERWFNVDIDYNPSLIGDCMVRTVYNGGEKLSNIMESLSYIYGFNYKITSHNTIEIEGGGCL